MADAMQTWLQDNLETFRFVGNEKTYVAIQPFVARLGLEWERERRRFLAESHWEYHEEQVEGEPVAGLPAEKLFIYLKVVDTALVSEELSEPLRQYQEVSRRMTRDAFLRGDLLKAARAKQNPSPLERKLIEAAEILEREMRAEAADNDPSES